MIAVVEYDPAWPGRFEQLRQEYAAAMVAAASQALARLGFTPMGDLRGKNAMVQQILAAAGLTDAERASIDANQVPSHDWDAGW